MICFPRRFDLLRWGLALMLLQTLGEALAMRSPQSLDSGGLSDYNGFLRLEGLVHRMNGVSGFLACHSASARSSNASGASASVFPHVEGFFSVKKRILLSLLWTPWTATAAAIASLVPPELNRTARATVKPC